MSNKFKYLILLLVIVFLCLPRPALAVWGIGDVGLFDVFDNILSGVEEKVGPMLTAVITVLSFYAIGIAFLALSSNFLESFISQQGQWMANLEPMTQAGWNFTAGLANMLLVLILLVIALAFILKIESFKVKQTLPKLLLVALLINFSWVFVKILLDITQIIYNTILPEESLFEMAMKTLLGSATSTITSIISWIGAIIIGLSIPMANSFFQIVLATMYTALILPNIIIWVIQAIFFYLLSLMFLSFAFLFAARVFIIQILIILSPLAFLSLILPQTKSFWSQWYKFLLEWLLLGIFFLFFLVLGFGALRFLVPEGMNNVMLPGFGFFGFGAQIIYYFAVFIYMAVILFIGKKFVPTGAQQLIDFGKGLAGTVLTRGLAPFGKATKKNLTNFATSQRETEERVARLQARATAMGRSKLPLFSGRQKMALGAGRWTRKGVELGHRLAGTTLNEERMKSIEKAREEGKKIRDPNLLTQKIKSALGRGDKDVATGLISAGIEKGGPWKKALQAEGLFNKRDVISMAAQANATGAGGEAETLAQGYMHQLSEEDLGKAGFKLSDEDKTKYGFTSLKDKIWGKARTADLGRFKDGSWLDENGKIIEPILKRFEGRKVAKMYEEFGPGFAEDYMTGAQEKGLKWFAENNPGAALWLTGNGAQDMGFTSLRGVSGKDYSRNEVKDLINKIRGIAKKKEEKTKNEEKRIRKIPEEPEAPEEYAAYRTAEQRQRVTETPSRPETSEEKRSREQGRFEAIKNIPGFRRTGIEKRDFERLSRELPSKKRQQRQVEIEQEKEKHTEDLRKYSERYKQLKENPVRGANEQLEYTRLLERMRDKGGQIKKLGGDLRTMKDVERNIGGDIEATVEYELSRTKTKASESAPQIMTGRLKGRGAQTNSLPRQDFERIERQKRIELEKIENEYKALKKAKPPDYENRQKGYEDEISNIKKDLNYIKKKLKE